MATLLNNNLTGVAVLTNTAGLTATPYNFITLYNYAMQFQPELIPELYYANGNGDITGILELIGNTGNYQADNIKWAEQGRLHGRFNATVTGTTFTATSNHNLRVGDEILVVDPTAKLEAIGKVTAVTSATVFTALNKNGANWTSFSNTLTISGDFTNTFAKGSDTFASGKKWNPIIKENFTHIIKEVYEVPNSDRVHKTWIDTPNGAMWFSEEIERTRTLFRNKETLTHLFNVRDTTSAAATAGHEPGMKGVLQQVETGGNLINGYITALSDLENIALRAVQQNAGITDFMVFADMAQMNYFNTLAAGVNAAFSGGTNFGAFNNDENMYLKLDFKSIMVSGINFHFKHLRVLDDPSIYSFNTAGIAFLIVPCGKKEVEINGAKHYKPYFSTLYRNGEGINRRESVTLFGPGGTPMSKDVSRWEFLTETTNMVVGANSWFVGRKNSSHYSVG